MSRKKLERVFVVDYIEEIDGNKEYKSIGFISKYAAKDYYKDILAKCQEKDSVFLKVRRPKTVPIA